MIKDTVKTFADQFERSIESLFEADRGEYSLVADAMKYSLADGGKRLRPFLIDRFYKASGGNDTSSVNFQLAMECIHTYSLIHDDLPCMDNDDMRRGKPSCHKKFGEEYALLAGDGLLTHAFNVICSSSVSEERPEVAVPFSLSTPQRRTLITCLLYIFSPPLLAHE